MNESDNKTADLSEMAGLKEQCAQLSRQVTILLVAAVTGSIAFAGFVGLQVRRFSKDLDTLRPQVAQIREATAKDMPHFQEFMVKLADYGRTHPEFQPIVTRYGLTNSGPVPLGSKK